ncbi:MAG: sigma-54-dependent transcriptional regulator [Gammaproteobacteria bacterium]
MHRNTRIAIVEDDAALREALCETAALAGYEVCEFADGASCLDALHDGGIELVISDVQMSPMNGLELLREIRRRNRDIPVLMMTAYGSVQTAIDAMKHGATDYLLKPFEAEVLVASLGQFLASPAAEPGEMIAEDPATLRAVELARRVARTDTSVMITGESGVGKEVFFRLIHRSSRRGAHAPLAINCAAIPDNMLEAVLFGHEKGAFTGAYKSCPGKFEQAQHSTLLLDEVSEMSLPLQAKLLRVLQERQVERVGGSTLIDLDVRVIATSNRDLLTEVRAGRFREDLYYRLNVFPLHVPPLRERRLDILPLARFLLARAAQRADCAVPVLGAGARAALQAYAWPGNIRELDNVMQRALIVHAGHAIEADDLLFEAAAAPREVPPVPPAAHDEAAAETLGDDLRDHERKLILDALDEGGGSRKYAAEKLGISPRTLRYKLARMRDEGLAVPGH